MIPVKFKSLDSVDVLYDEMIKNISKKNAAMMDNIDQWCRKELDRSLEYIIFQGKEWKEVSPGGGIWFCQVGK